MNLNECRRRRRLMEHIVVDEGGKSFSRLKPTPIDTRVMGGSVVTGKSNRMYHGAQRNAPPASSFQTNDSSTFFTCRSNAVEAVTNATPTPAHARFWRTPKNLPSIAEDEDSESVTNPLLAARGRKKKRPEEQGRSNTNGDKNQAGDRYIKSERLSGSMYKRYLSCIISLFWRRRQKTNKHRDEHPFGSTSFEQNFIKKYNPQASYTIHNLYV